MEPKFRHLGDVRLSWYLNHAPHPSLQKQGTQHTMIPHRLYLTLYAYAKIHIRFTTRLPNSVRSKKRREFGGWVEGVDDAVMWGLGRVNCVISSKMRIARTLTRWTRKCTSSVSNV